MSLVTKRIAINITQPVDMLPESAAGLVMSLSNDNLGFQSATTTSPNATTFLITCDATNSTGDSDGTIQTNVTNAMNALAIPTLVVNSVTSQTIAAEYSPVDSDSPTGLPPW